MEKLIKGEILPRKYQDHELHGEYKDCRDCHITPDWILIYEIKKNTNEIYFYRTGSHSNLYR
jgi:mRNA interferase YafQ